MSLPRFSVAQRLHPHPFTITMQVTTLISPVTNSFYILGEGEDMFEDPPRMHRGDGGSHYPRVIVRLADRLLRIRADLTDAVDSAYSDLCSRP